MRRQHRLSSSKDIQRVLRLGRKNDRALFRVIILPNSCGYARLALIAPRTVDKRAVVRNRLRRRAREWARAQPHILPISAAIILIFKKQAARASRTIFYEELEKYFSQV